MFIQNIINKYGIFNLNIYNFNKIDFFMGILLHAKVKIISNYKNKFCIKQFGICK